jgi:hypothetical protein
VQKGEKSNRYKIILDVCKKIGGGSEEEVLTGILNHTTVGKNVKKENIPPCDGLFFFNLSYIYF